MSKKKYRSTIWRTVEQLSKMHILQISIGEAKNTPTGFADLQWCDDMIEYLDDGNLLSKQQLIKANKLFKEYSN